MEILAGSCVSKPHAPLILQSSKTTTSDSMTSTLSAILVLFDCAISATNVIAFTFEIIRMTGGAERCVLVESPVKSIFNGIAVAATTRQYPSVVTRIIPIRIMSEGGWRPAVC